jgi:hypothetical protein
LRYKALSGAIMHKEKRQCLSGIFVIYLAKHKGKQGIISSCALFLKLTHYCQYSTMISGEEDFMSNDKENTSKSSVNESSGKEELKIYYVSKLAYLEGNKFKLIYGQILSFCSAAFFGALNYFKPTISSFMLASISGGILLYCFGAEKLDKMLAAQTEQKLAELDNKDSPRYSR